MGRGEERSGEARRGWERPERHAAARRGLVRHGEVRSGVPWLEWCDMAWKRLVFSDLPDPQWIGIFSSNVGIG